MSGPAGLPEPVTAQMLDGVRVVLVDGGSGAGKTRWATRLAEGWRELTGAAVQLVSMDSFYPGWHGLAAAQQILLEEVLRSEHPGYPTWDWERDVPAPRVSLDASLPLLVEGCGALIPATAALAGLRVWLEMPAPRREQRALGRDGENYAPYWDTWARQEQAHWHAHRPWLLADVVVPANLLS